MATRRPRRRMWGPVLGAAGTALVVYALTLAPSLVWSHWGTDGGDFVAAAVSGRVPHPPGFPTYYWLSRAVVGVIPGDPARALNWLSALMASGAVALTVATALRRGISGWGSLAAGLSLACAPWFWGQAVITEVYTAAAFFFSLTLYLAEGARQSGRGGWLPVGLSLGLAMSVHPTVALLGLIVAAGANVAWMWFSLGVVLGLLPYGFLAVSGPWPQPWGDMGAVRGWIEFVSARMYWGNAFTLPAAYWSKRFLAWIVLALRQLTPIGFLLAALGLYQSWQQNRGRALGLLAASVLITFYAIGYNSADSWVYLIAYLPAWALALGSGLDGLQRHHVPACCGLMIPFVLLGLNWQKLDLHLDREATAWLSDTLAQLPPGAMVVTAADQHTFALWYAVDAVGARRDLLVVDRRLWGYGPYTEYLGREGLGERDRTDAAGTLSSLAGERPFCEVDGEGGVTCR